MALGEALRPVGEIVFEADGRRETSMFRYAADWLADPGRFAVAPTMPLGAAPFYSAGSRERRRAALPGPIADGAPDSWGRGLVHKALPGVLTEPDYLLAVDDATRQGALRYLDDEGRPLARTYPPTPRLAALDELRRLAGLDSAALNRNPAARALLLGSAGSLGGARPKASVLISLNSSTPSSREAAMLLNRRSASFNRAAFFKGVEARFPTRRRWRLPAASDRPRRDPIPTRPCSTSPRARRAAWRACR